MDLVFITGRGGAGFQSPDPALIRGRGEYFSADPRPAPVWGPHAFISWMGPHLLPPLFNSDLSGVWAGWGPEWGQGQGMLKKTPRPRPLRGVGWGKGPGGPRFSGPPPPCKKLQIDLEYLMYSNTPSFRHLQRPKSLGLKYFQNIFHLFPFLQGWP